MSLNIKAYVMLVLASIFWAGNFIIGKFAFVESISPFSLVFFRWLTVWFILFPFTYKEILSKKKEISNYLPLLLFLGLTSVGLFNSFVYVSLQYTQVINASLFNSKPLVRLPAGTRQHFPKGLHYKDIIGAILEYHKSVAHLLFD